jgi:hypothetical protein
MAHFQKDSLCLAMPFFIHNACLKKSNIKQILIYNTEYVTETWYGVPSLMDWTHRNVIKSTA